MLFRKLHLKFITMIRNPRLIPLKWAVICITADEFLSWFQTRTSQSISTCKNSFCWFLQFRCKKFLKMVIFLCSGFYLTKKRWPSPANCVTVKPKRTTFQWGDRDVYYQSALHVYLVIRLKFPVHSFPVTTIFQHPWHLTIQKSKYRIPITSLDSLQKLQLTRTTQSGTIFHGYVNHWNDKRETALLWSRI